MFGDEEEVGRGGCAFQRSLVPPEAALDGHGYAAGGGAGLQSPGTQRASVCPGGGESLPRGGQVDEDTCSCALRLAGLSWQ